MRLGTEYEIAADVRSQQTILIGSLLYNRALWCF